MLLRICDRCGKQIDRFVGRPEKYKYERDGEEYGRGPDRNERIKYGEPRAYFREHLDLCDDCRQILDNFMDTELSKFPSEVTLSTKR